MKLKLVSTLLLLAGALAAQNTSVNITVQQSGAPAATAKNVPLVLRPKTIVTNAACAPTLAGMTTLEPGESAICTVALNQPARVGGFLLTITMPSQVVGPASATIPEGALSTTFTVTYNVLMASAAPIHWYTAGTTVWTYGSADAFVDLMVPCCYDDKHCGLFLEQVSQEPCLAG